MSEKITCLIIGGGPAGYTAGIYASRAGLAPVIYEGVQPGGQLTITSEVENFPGYPEGESGSVIVEDIRKQAMRMGAEIRAGEITEVDFSKRPFRLVVDYEKELFAETVIAATGATARWLGLESEAQYRGFGVSTCATCDGAFFKGKTVAVIGGGDTALEEAHYLSKIAEKVYLVHRRDQFRASKAMQDRIFNTPNIEPVFDAIPIEILGERQGFSRKVTGLRIQNKKTEVVTDIALDGIFVAIGVTPVTDLFVGQLELDESGYIKTHGARPLTNVPGVFAAGDVQDPYYRQACTAAASGCKAAMEAERFLLI
ncbi:MAG: thioredoxin-disulfide reductase [Bacteroidales bacterium]|jgi:thioredoxin reductase (NADPH)|nr:thioredoxin-disulfide reductase [Bacteroidales bacterium]